VAVVVDNPVMTDRAAPEGLADEPMAGAPSRRPPRARLSFYHANTKGSGAAIQLEEGSQPNGDERGVRLFLDMAHQKTVPSKGENGRVPATFDWAQKATVKLSPQDIFEFLAVLGGKKDQGGDERLGIYHDAGATNTAIVFKRDNESGGYGLSISKKDKEGNSAFRGYILLSEPEGLGLQVVLQAALVRMVFGSVSA
jgi:hypothetical protein